MNRALIRFSGFVGSTLLSYAKIIYLEISNFLLSGYLIVPLTWGLVVIYISPRFGTGYSPDSFANYLIGTNLLSGLGYVSQALREFYMPVSTDFYQPSRSFPPLMPLLVGFFGKITGKGIESGLYVNLLVLLALFHVNYFLSKKLLGKSYLIIFLLLPFFIFNNDPFIDEIISGRSVPAAALWLMCVFYFACDDKLVPKQLLILGGCLGLLILTRFDALIFCTLFVIYSSMARSKKSAVYISAGLLLVAMPWLARNLITFGAIFSSDNAITALSIAKGTHSQISHWMDGPLLLNSDPNLWATQRIDFLIANLKVLLGSLGGIGGGITLLIATFFVFLPRIEKKSKIFITITCLWAFANLAAVSLTPYHDARYFSILTFIIGFSALLVVHSFLLNASQEVSALENCVASGKFSLLGQYILIIFILLGSLWAIDYFVRKKIEIGDMYSGYYSKIYTDFKSVINDGELVACYAPENLAYYSTWKTINLPVNTSNPDNDFVSYKNKFNVKYALLRPDSNIIKHPLAVVKGATVDFVLVDISGIKYYENFPAKLESPHQVGNYSNDRHAIVAKKGESGAVVFGQNIKLIPGRYAATFDVSATSPTAGLSLGLVDISARKPPDPENRLISLPLNSQQSSQKVTVEFTVTSPELLYEFRVWSNGAGVIEFRNVQVKLVE